MNRWAFPITVAALLLAGAARADERELPQELRGVGIEQRLGEQVPLDLTFRDEDGREARLGQYFQGRPVILVLAYYRCPMLCTQVLNGLLECLRGLVFDAGRQFQVVTVSFDPRERPELAAAKKASYLEQYGRPGADQGWHFLTGDQPAIDALTRAVGFRYRYDAKADQFAHASGLVLLTPQGQVARYFYGLGGRTEGSGYTARDLRLGLVEASAGQIGSPVDQVLLFCFHYDPATGKYTTTAMALVRVAAVLTVALLGSALGLAWWRAWRKGRRRGLPPAGPRAGEAVSTEGMAVGP